MSKADEIMKMKRQQKTVTPTQALGQPMNAQTKEQKNVGSYEREKEEKIERTRRSFDVRTDLYKKLKVLSSEEDVHIYMLIEEAIETYLEERQ